MPTLTREEVFSALATLKTNGLTFSDCVGAFGADDEEQGDEGAYVREAKLQAKEGFIEVDDVAVVSVSGDHGAYVQAWLWVSDRDIWTGPIDCDGVPCRAINQYRCDNCQHEWEGQWSCECDDRCPKCDQETEPYDSLELDLEGKVIE